MIGDLVTKQGPDLEVPVDAAVEPGSAHDAFEGEAASLRHASGCCVFGVDVQLQPIDALEPEEVADQQLDRLAGVATAGVLMTEELVGDLVATR